MTRVAAILAALLSAAPAAAFERLGVVAVSDPPSGPDADLAELAHQLRAACRDRIGGVDDVPTMRARLLGQTSNATLSELDRAYGGALAVYQNGEFESALRTLHAIVEDLESLPETADSYSQWVRAQLRLAHTAMSVKRDGEADDALFTLAKTDIAIAADPEQYSPAYRRRFDGIKAKVRALPARRLVVTSEGRPGAVFVNGRNLGTTPLSAWLPAGTYRIGGASEDLRVPSFRIDLRNEDRSVVLDFALAEALRVNAGPGLALPLARRGDGIVRAGAWLGVDRVVAVTRVFEGQAAFLLGSMYDVRRGALLREGSVRMVAGTVPAANLGALAAFLLTGQGSRDVVNRTDVARATPPPPAAAAAPPPSPPLDPAPAVKVAAATATEPVAPPPPKDPPAPVAAAAPPVAAPPAAPPKPARKTAAVASTPAGAATPVPSKPLAPVAKTEPAASPEPPKPATQQPPEPAKPSLAAAPAAEPARSLRLDGPRPVGRNRWMRPAAYGSGAAAIVFLVLAVQQGLDARTGYADADAMLSNGTFRPGSDLARYDALVRDADSAKRNAYLSAGATAVFAATAGYLGWRSIEAAGPELAVRF